MDTLIANVVAITVIAYLVGIGCKAVDRVNDKYIPVIVGAVGGVLGVIGLYTMPDFPVHDILNAIAVGIASGLASTGCNQIVKQLSQKGDD